MSYFRLLAVSLLLLVAPAARALGPHEILLLVNRNSPDSTAIAREYCRLRGVPEPNLVLLDLPYPAGKVPVEIAAADFTRLIWDPATAAAKARGIQDHILAWVYSVDFPVRIAGNPPGSITGLTFLRNRPASQTDVAQALYRSPLFAGPESPQAAGFPAQSLDVQKAWLAKDTPLPAMMLGYVGPNGNTRAEVLACLERGAKADAQKPDGTVYFATNTDVRSVCRLWEIPSAANELKSRRIRFSITNALPIAATDVIGLMAGAADLDLKSGPAFLPGAMAEHLTSFGAMFDTSSQTKITEWIRAGATASAGTVTEPLSAWPKFPHARFHAHSAAGCTIIESFYQSLRCPLQILPLGDPLCAPWRSAATLTIKGLASGRVENRTRVSASVEARPDELYNRFLFLLDGRPFRALAKESTVTLDPAALPAGRHVLRAVAYSAGSLRQQAFADAPFEVVLTP